MNNRISVENKFPNRTHLNNHISVKDVVGDLADVRTRDLPFLLKGKKHL